MLHDGLALLEARVASDLDRIAHPRSPWLVPRTGRQGTPVLDVLIVGAGQSGLAIAFGLLRSQVTNILVIDKAPAGQEGPWATYARMATLRSPKDFTGPDLDIPSLTYQSWHEAKFGTQSWQDLALIPGAFWMDYLNWYRSVTNLPVRNNVEVVDIGPEDGVLRVEVRVDGQASHFLCRKLVLATGQEGMGGWTMPAAIAALPEARRAHVAEPIDFAALAGRHVVVIGAGASAFDNAATALEAGARVTLLCRRPEAQAIQPYRWLTFRGFLRHFADLDDAWRWRFMTAILEMREGFPQATFDRCARQEAFRLHLGAPVLSARPTENGVILEKPGGPIEADFVIAATGIDMNFGGRSELGRFAGNIATWGDRYAPPAEEANPRLARFPYLADDYALTEREASLTPWIGDIHLFSIASTMSFGASGSSINAMTTAVPKLVHGLTRGLFKADIDRHWASFQAYDVKQATVAGACVVPPGQST